MNVSKIAVNTAHRKWCQDFLAEQNKTTSIIRKFIKENATYNPFSSTQFDELLKRYEKNFWGLDKI